jgi:tetratricopeptide (TPR) repeat protein
MVCFEMGDFAEAMDFFADAHEKSGGEIWDAVDPKFEHFFQEQLAEDDEDEEWEEDGEAEELDDEIFEKIQQLADEGNELMDRDAYDAAVAKFEEALNLLPEPRGDWEATTWLYASIGDAYFFKKDFKASSEAFYNAFQAPNGNLNPFILLRLGQALLETGDEPNATEYLLRAYMIEGRDVFLDENPKYFLFLESKVDLDKDLE